MISFSRLTSKRFLIQVALVRASSVNHQRYLASESDGDDASKKKTTMATLLNSLRQTDRKVDGDVLQKERKQQKQSQGKHAKRQHGSMLEYKDTAKEISSLESDQKENVSRSSESTKSTMTRVYKVESMEPVSSEMNDKLKSILSKLKVDTAKSQLSKDIVGAVKTWGRMSPRSRKDIEHDFNMQSNPGPAIISKVISLTTGAKLDLFDDVFDGKTSAKEALPTLTLLEGEDMELIEKQRSLDQRNDFLTLIEMSDKQWKFPVDNEVCKVEEEGVGFEEHVFLGHLLDSFPKKGPVRRFMELVVNGLEQNPYMSVEQKKKQVLWFEEYFNNIPEEDLSF